MSVELDLALAWLDRLEEELWSKRDRAKAAGAPSMDPEMWSIDCELEMLFRIRNGLRWREHFTTFVAGAEDMIPKGVVPS